MVLNDFPRPPLWESIFPTSLPGALPNEKGSYSWRILAGVHPRLPDGARGISGKRGKCGGFGISEISGEIRRGGLALSRVDF